MKMPLMSIDRKRFLKSIGVLGMGGLGRWTRFNEGTAGNSDPQKPERISRGDTIGMVSPASTLSDRSAYGKIVANLRSMGYRVREGEHARRRHGNFAGTDTQRASDLMAMFRDPDISAIMAFRGGWGANRILELLDYEVIRSHPKALIGFSDVTALLLSIYARCGLITFHGPVGKSEWNSFTTESFRKALHGTDSYALKGKKRSHLPIREGRAEGRLLGGNLSVLTSLIGSEFLPDFRNAILFLEDVGESYYRIDRMMTQLALSGILDEINGFIFGTCTECSRDTPQAHGLDQILNHHISSRNIPSFSGFPFGHVDETLTLPVGLPARMDAGRGSLELLESPVR